MKSSVKVGVIFPSRGLVFSQTADELLQNLKDIPHMIYFSHGQPIPDCFENPTNRALEDKSITHLWFVEDDMILNPTTLKDMLDMDKAVVTCDYPVNSKGRGAVFKDKGGKVLFTGTGCLLVKREVFKELKKPYFRTDVRWSVKNMGDYIKLTGANVSNIDGYGLHDVNFGINVNLRGIPIHECGTVGQRKLIALGKAGSNDGAHKIDLWTEVKKDHLLREIMTWPITETGDLVPVLTPTGEVLCSKEHAKKLIKKGLGVKPPTRHSVIDESET